MDSDPAFLLVSVFPIVLALICLGFRGEQRSILHVLVRGFLILFDGTLTELVPREEVANPLSTRRSINANNIAAGRQCSGRDWSRFRSIYPFLDLTVYT